MPGDIAELVDFISAWATWIVLAALVIVLLKLRSCYLERQRLKRTLERDRLQSM